MISDSIPIDLILEILSRLPVKSITRFHCVSKLWSSLLTRPYFKELFLTRSSAHPRLLFAIEEKALDWSGEWSFFSLPRHCQSPYEKSVAAEFHMKFPPENLEIYSHDDRLFSCGYASGLIYFYGMCPKEEYHYGVPMICNPNTGQYATLPYLLTYMKAYSFLGFDPIDKQFKVLFMDYPGRYDKLKVLTLGTGEIMKWRTIKCPIINEPCSEGICINGVLYYLGDHKSYVRYDDETASFSCVIVCFDVRSEQFKFIYLENFCKLINYKGKLGLIYWEEEDDVCLKDEAIELRMWVLEDAEKQEWSKYAYTLRDDNFFGRYVSIVGGTAMGEIVLSMSEYTSKEPFYVFYFNPERNTLQSVEIKGFGEYYHGSFKKHCVYTFVDHVEDLNVNDAKLLNSSIYAPYVKTGEEEESEESEEEGEDRDDL